MSLSYQTILSAVQNWSLSERMALVKEILQTVPPKSTEQSLQFDLENALGLLSVEPMPTDEQLVAILREERFSKYG